MNDLVAGVTRSLHTALVADDLRWTATIERRKREDRGTEGAEGVGRNTLRWI